MKVCLCMIVKNEAHILARCLEAVRPLIDCWAIVDTGSTDRTLSIPQDLLDGMPGGWADAPWEGFGASRTRALALAERVAGPDAYALIVDADDIWSGTRPELGDADAYSVWFERPKARWTTARYIRLGRGIRYEGVVHEMPVMPDGKPPQAPLIEGPRVMSPNDGASWKDPDKYLHHARAISQALVDDPGNTRYAFYLAQSFRDHGDDERASKLYLARASMGPGSYAEEVYVSFLEAGRALWRLGRIDDAKRAFLNAHASYPQRREAMAELARVFATKAATSPPAGTLFVERLPTDDEEAA